MTIVNIRTEIFSRTSVQRILYGGLAVLLCLITATATAGAATTSKRTSSSWSVNLLASMESLWPTEYTNITAYANQDVSGGGYYLSIYDMTAGEYIAICSSGDTCGTSVTEATATTHTYKAFISSNPTTYPPANQQATDTVTVTWRSLSVSLQATPLSLTVGSATSLQATANVDVADTPFYIQIFDTTTNTRIAVCGTGVICMVSASQSSVTTHRYVAYISDYDSTVPISGKQATSLPVYVSWTAP